MLLHFCPKYVWPFQIGFPWSSGESKLLSFYILLLIRCAIKKLISIYREVEIGRVVNFNPWGNKTISICIIPQSYFYRSLYGELATISYLIDSV